MKIPPPLFPRASSRPTRPATRRRLAPPSALTPSIPFHAFIAYADVPAAGRAMGTINDVLRGARGKHALRPMLWRFNQLINPKWRDRAIADAALANVVVLASTSASTLTPELESWVRRFLAHNRGQRTTLVALFGSDDAWTISIEESHATEAANEIPVFQQRVA